MQDQAPLPSFTPRPDDPSLRALQAEVHQWITTVGIRYFSELTNTAVLMEEVGELARLMARGYGEQSFKKGESLEDLPEEMADILFVLLCLANQTGTDLTEAFSKRMARKTERDKDRHKQNEKLQD